MRNLLLEPVDYKFEDSFFGTWRRFLPQNGNYYAEFRTHVEILGLPLIHITLGKSPETGRRVVAKGVIAIGRFAVGIVSIGQVSAGLIAFGQLGLGVLWGVGQGTTGIVAFGQLALAALFGLGQISTGFVAVGQIAVGHYVLAQKGFGTYVWDMMQTSPDAHRFFTGLASRFL
jgi:hypothetical protein